jgi:RHS repeat-associated protein
MDGFRVAPPIVVGQVSPDHDLYYYHVDHLGTPRLLTDANGDIDTVHKYFPFGDEIQPLASDNTHRFTGHERDPETGLDYMLARYYASGQGRFFSVDPGDDSLLTDPQRWNRYAYVRNNPVNANDPDGKFLDTIVDAAFIVLDVVDIAASAISGEGVSKTQVGALAADVGGLLVPFATGGGLAVKAASKVDDVVDGARAGGNVLENAAKGKAAEAAVATELKAEGKTILGSQVTAKTSEGTRRIDHLVESGGTVGAVEVKSGNATRSASQVAKDNAMASEGATLVGKNAPNDLKGKPVKIETEVRRPNERP